MPADLAHVSSFPQGQGGLGAVEGRGVGLRKHKQAREGGYGAEDFGMGGGQKGGHAEKTGRSEGCPALHRGEMGEAGGFSWPLGSDTWPSAWADALENPAVEMQGESTSARKGLLQAAEGRREPSSGSLETTQDSNQGSFRPKTTLTGVQS